MKVWMFHDFSLWFFYTNTEAVHSFFCFFSTSSRKKQREEEDNCSKEWLTLIELVMQKGDVSDMIGLVERIMSPTRVCEIRIMIKDFVLHEWAVCLKKKYPDICMICNC